MRFLLFGRMVSPRNNVTKLVIIVVVDMLKIE